MNHTIALDYKAFVLDFDDTLVSSRVGRLPLLAQTARALGLSYAADAEKAAWGQPFARMLEILVPGAELASFLEAYRAVMRQRPPLVLPGVRNFLNAAAASGLVSVILTSSLTQLVIDDLESAELAATIARVFGSDVTEHTKPDGRALVPVLDYLTVSCHMKTGEIVYIGDSVADAIVAKSNAVDFIGVLTGTTSPQAFADAGATCIVSSFEELHITGQPEGAARPLS